MNPPAYFTHLSDKYVAQARWSGNIEMSWVHQMGHMSEKLETAPRNVLKSMRTNGLRDSHW